MERPTSRVSEAGRTFSPEDAVPSRAGQHPRHAQRRRRGRVPDRAARPRALPAITACRSRPESHRASWRVSAGRACGALPTARSSSTWRARRAASATLRLGASSPISRWRRSRARRRVLPTGPTEGASERGAALTLATRKLGELIARMPAGPGCSSELLRGAARWARPSRVARSCETSRAPRPLRPSLDSAVPSHAVRIDLSGETAGQQLADALSDEGRAGARGRLPPQRLASFPTGGIRSARHAGRGHHRHGRDLGRTHAAFGSPPRRCWSSPSEDARQGLAFHGSHGATSA